MSDVETSRMTPAQAWDVVWSELKTVGIVRGEIGPIDENLSCGRNAERAIRGLQLTELSAVDVQNIGMLVQAAIHAAGLARKRPGLD
jgi:hypothetical protein